MAEKKPDPKAGEKTPEEKAAEAQAALTKQMTDMVTSVGSLAKGFKTVQDSIQATNERLEKMEQGVSAKPVDDTPAAIDLEQLDRTQYANHIVGEVIKQLKPEFDKVLKDVGGVREGAHKTAVSLQLEKAEAAHKDFWEWEDEIRELAKDNKGLSIERLYTLAKSESPDKAKEIDEKAAAEKAEADGGSGDKGKGKNFGGLTPTSSTTEETTGMTKNEAADKAFEETMEGFS